MSHDAAPGTKLAAFTSRLQVTDLPAQTRDLAALVLLDALGCLAVGRSTPDAAQVAAAAAGALGAAGDASTPAQRALELGYGISSSGSMDSYVPAKMHVTPSVVGAVLALAADRTVSGADLVTAVAAGLEASVRVADAFDPPSLRAHGWHAPGVIGPLGAAVACSRLLGLDRERTRNALGLAGSQSAGTFAAWGTPTVKFHQARGGVSGLLSAVLAETGFTSSPDVFCAADGGLLGVYADGGRPDRITVGLGEDWRMHDLSLRRWPTPHINVIATILELRRRHPEAVASAEHVAVEIPADAAPFSVFDSPTTRFEAMNSIPLAAATALLAGGFEQEHLDPDWFLGEQARACLRDRIQVSVSGELASGSIRAFPIPLRDTAHVVETHTLYGSRHDPIGRASLVDKFVGNLRGTLAEPEARKLADRVLAVEQAEDAGELIRDALAPTH
jgi:2-methylcitrate dehydratase PrpD